MKKPLMTTGRTRTLLFIIAGLLAAGILLVSCGGGGYGGGGGGMYGGSGMGLPPAMFSLTSPADGALNVSAMPTLTWGMSLYATGYSVYLKTGSAPISSYMLITSTTATSFTITSPLTSATLYDWYVVANNSSGMATAATFTFTTM